MTTKRDIRQRAQTMNVALGPTIKKAGLIDWWMAAKRIDRADPNWQTVEAQINWGGNDPAALFDAPRAAPSAVPRAQPEPPAAATIPEPIPTQPTWWQRAKAWLRSVAR
jgi:hypothetical protein